MNKTQKQCDKLLSPLVAKLKPKCLLCNWQTQVAHHHVHKSKSLILRYDLDNLINLCNSCHFKLHYNESYWASKIVEIKWIEWFQDLDKRKNELCVGVNKIDYNAVYERLNNLLEH